MQVRARTVFAAITMLLASGCGAAPTSVARPRATRAVSAGLPAGWVRVGYGSLSVGVPADWAVYRVHRVVCAPRADAVEEVTYTKRFVTNCAAVPAFAETGLVLECLTGSARDGLTQTGSRVVDGRTLHVDAPDLRVYLVGSHADAVAWGLATHAGLRLLHRILDSAKPTGRPC